MRAGTRRSTRTLAASLPACALLASVLSLAPRAQIAQPSPADPWPVTFTDIAERAGLREPSIYGGIDRKRFIIETNGAGAALVDYDNDGWLDALVLGGTRLRPGTREPEEGAAPGNRLYRNLRNGTFRDVTAQRRQESEVRQSEARKTAILDTALDCIITMDHEGRVVDFNPAAERMTGRFTNWSGE